jgi:TPR repeat protein
LLVFEYFRPFFHEGDKEIRIERRQLLRRANQGDLSAAYILARQAYKANDLLLARKFFLRVVLGPSHDWAKASLYVGTIDFNAGRLRDAEHYWKQSAESGESTAMYNLAVLYKKEENIAGALHWFERAWLKGHVTAKKSLDLLKSMPSPQFNLTPRDAELVAAKWMVYWGYHDAKATPVGPDGGLDVIASRALAQVKYRNVKTSRTEINEFHGSAEGSGKDELYFSLSGYTDKALERAEEKSIALFIFNDQGIPKPVNSAARRIGST